MAWRGLVVLAGVVAVIYALSALRLVVLPVIIAFLLCTVLVPPARWLERRGFPRLLASWVSLLGFFGVLVGVILLLAPTVRDEFDDLGPTLDEAQEEVYDYLEDSPLDLSRDEVDRYLDQGIESLEGSSSAVTERLASSAIIAGEIVAGFLLLIVLVFFFLKDGERFCEFGLRQLPPERQDLARALGRRAWATVSGYVRGTAIVAAVDATIIGIGLAVIGVPLVLPLAVLTFLGAFFPLVGATAAGIVAVLVALVTGGVGDAVLAGALVVLVQQIEGDVLAPLVLGKAVALHPVVILLSLAAGAVVAGLIGAFLAVPVAAVAVAIASELKSQHVVGPDPDSGIIRP